MTEHTNAPSVTEALAQATQLKVSTIEATGWNAQEISAAFNRVSAAHEARAFYHGLSHTAGALALVTGGMMLLSPRFFIFAVPLMLASWYLRGVGKDVERRRIDDVARDIERAALERLSAPKV